jgi:hypothetical protein
MSPTDVRQELKVAPFVRVATDGTDRSNQRREGAVVCQVAAREGWLSPTIVSEVRARGFSGDALDGLCTYDAGVVSSYIRFSRSSNRPGEVMEVLVGAGVEVVVPESGVVRGLRLRAVPVERAGLDLLPAFSALMTEREAHR